MRGAVEKVVGPTQSRAENGRRWWLAESVLELSGAGALANGPVLYFQKEEN